VQFRQRCPKKERPEIIGGDFERTSVFDLKLSVIFTYVIKYSNLE
jgi:hypothetical protein